MDLNKLDNIFREGADQFRPTPGPDTWQKIQGELNHEKTSWKFYLGIAASLVVLVVSAIIFMNDTTTTSKSTAVIEGDFGPETVVAADMMIPVKSQDLGIPIKEEKEKITSPIANPVLEMEPVKTQMLLAQVPTKIGYMTSINEPIIHEIKLSEPQQDKIQIQYIADATNDAKDSSKGKIGKLLDLAQSTSPAEMLANMREAKDNFLSSKFSLD